MSMINVTNLTFAYDGSYENIFENVSFQLDTDWKLGFTGRNGRGKTTFLNLLLGKYRYTGSIAASVRFEYFPYEISDRDRERQTVEVLRSVIPDYEEWQLLRELNLLEVPEEALYRGFSTLSGGEQTKILLAALFLKENSFLLIDEPTNHLDMEARKLVADYLSRKRGFILVSHDRRFLDTCIDHVLSINKTSIDVQKGNFSSWLYNKELSDNFELAENQRLKKDIEKMEEAAKRTSKWSDAIEKTKKGTRVAGLKPDTGHIGHQAAKMMKKSKNLEKRQNSAMEEKSKLLKNIERSDELKLVPLKYHSDPLVEIENLSIFYGEKEVCSDVNLKISRGDRIALRGKNGCGKSSVLKLLCGEKREQDGDFNYSGILRLGSNLKISYVSQDTWFLKGNLNAFIRESQVEESLFKAVLRKLDFSREQFEKKMGDYSGGQKKKVLLARSLCTPAHLYVWDEPLNFVDVISRMQIETLLIEYEPTILFVEHDISFCESIATREIIMYTCA